MSDRKPNTQELAFVVSKLCSKFDLCLSPIEAQRLAAEPPETAQAFTDAVFRAVGLDPGSADRELYRQVCTFVARICYTEAI